MKFVIETASVSDSRPCKKAYMETINRTVNKRTFTIERYYVDINTLEELMELIEEIDEDVIVNKERILIYDSWLE